MHGKSFSISKGWVKVDNQVDFWGYWILSNQGKVFIYISGKMQGAETQEMEDTPG